ncbi:MAG: DUF11 domain-containing protein [Nitrospirota bacterium]
MEQFVRMAMACRRVLAALALAVVLAVPTTALAWPLDSEWFAFTRSSIVWSDPVDGGTDLDIVGSAGPVAGACASSCPAASIFNDGTYLYLRIRLDGDPSGLRPFGWGFLIDTNNVLTDYEWMIMVNGVSNPDQIEIDRNVLQGTADDPTDKVEVVGWSETADENTNYRIMTADSTFNSTPDYFLDLRIPYATFKAVTGLTDQSPIRFFVGTSNSAQTLSNDLLALTISGGISDVVLPLGTQPTTGTVSFVSSLTSSVTVTTAYQGQTLYIRAADSDRNMSSATYQTLTAIVATGNDSETVLLTETGADTGVFSGSLVTAGGPPAAGDGTLQVSPIEAVAATYVDAIDLGLTMNQNRSAMLTVLSSADLAVTKTASNTAPTEGAIVDFTLTVTNNGPNAATGIQVTDLLPADLKHESDSGGGTYNKNTGTWGVPPLASGGSATLLISTSVRNGTNGNTITNTAAITAASLPDPVSGNNSASVTITVGGADLAVSKTVDDPAPAAGGSITYTIGLTNNGGNAASGVLVTDLLPAGVSYASHVVTQGTYTPASGIWSAGALASGATTTLTITATVTAAAGSSVVNTASVTASDQADGNTANNSAGATIFVGGADLAVAKSVSNASPNEGAAVSYRVTVTNNGPGSPTGVQVADLLPAGLTFTSALASQGTYTTATGVWTIGALATSATLTINATVNAGTNGQTITNTAAVTASSVGDAVTANNTASAPLTVQRAEVALSKLVSSSSPTLGASISYLVVARNNGPNAATNLQVSDLLPALVTYASSTVSPPGSTYTSGTGLWNIGTLASGATTTLRINVTVSSNSNDALKTVLNTAAITNADQADPVGTNNAATASFTIQGCDLAVAKTVSNATPASGSNVTFTITIRNNGPYTSDKNVTVYDVLPTGLAYVSDTTTAGNYGTASGAWDFGNTTIASGATHTMTITAQVTAPTGSAVTNQANNAALYDFDLSNNLAAATVLVGGTDIAVTKTADTLSPNAGSSVVFTIAAKNNGPNSAANVTVLDALATGLTYSASSATQGAYDPGTGLWTIPALATGATGTLTLTATVNSGTGGTTLTNTASLTAPLATDTNTANNAASVVLSVQSADLSVTKSANNLTPNELDPVVYTVTVTNNGPNDAAGVTVLDLLSTSLTYSSAVVSQGSYSSTSGSWAVGAVAKNASATLQITARANVGSGGTNVPNTASITAAAQEDPNGANNSASVTITPAAVLAPSITGVKTVRTLSDPYNTTTNPKAIPGAVMLYTMTVVNSGPGAADADTLAITDPVPSDTLLCVSTLCSDPPIAFTCSAAPACGLTYTYATAVTYTNRPGGVGPYDYTPAPDANGYDGLVTGFRVNPAGAFSASGGAPHPQFTVQFKVKIR